VSERLCAGSSSHHAAARSSVLRCLHGRTAARVGQLLFPLVRQPFLQPCSRLLQRGPLLTRYINSSQSGYLVVESAIYRLFAQFDTTIKRRNRPFDERLQNSVESVRLMGPAPSAWSDALPREAVSSAAQHELHLPRRDHVVPLTPPQKSFAARLSSTEPELQTACGFSTLTRWESSY
jgi:hypothetical protein